MAGSSSAGFAHQRLDVYEIAQELATGVARATRSFPRGYADLRDQLNRSALSTVRHIAEGASRTTPKDKGARFSIARGEVAECDASLDSAARLALAEARILAGLRELADRVGAMLCRLIEREARREGKVRWPHARSGAHPKGES